jgi:uncharacterized membrane protein YkvA (DUF1232 family)
MKPSPPFYPLGPLGLAKLVRHLPNFARLYWRLFQDRRVSVWPKLLLVAAFAYAVSPVDFIPDLLAPFVGEVDDLMIIAVALRLFIPLCPREVVDQHVRAIDAGQ